MQKIESKNRKTAEFKAIQPVLACKSLVFIASLTILIFITGCKPPQPEAVTPEPPQAESAKVESPNPEPEEAKPAKIEPVKAEPVEIKPPKPEPKPESIPEVSFHNKCVGILAGFVNEQGRVDYKKLKRNRAELKNVMNEFAELDPNEYNRWPKADKIAFWINTYNIHMLRIILDNYPIESTRVLRVIWPPDSIRHIAPTRMIGVAKWDAYKFIVMDEEFTLREIQQRFLRKEFDEPRAFLALTQGSVSGPPLRNEPYCGRTLYKQLDDQAKRFLSNKHGLVMDREKQRVYLSAMLQSTWFGNDFIDKYGTDKKFKSYKPTERAVLSFISNYIDQQDVSYLETGNYSVRYINYNWRINE